MDLLKKVLLFIFLFAGVTAFSQKNNAVQKENIKKTIDKYLNKKNKPLFIYDGVKTSADKIKKLNLNDIRGVVFIKSRKARKLYSDNSLRNGVLEIYLY